MTDPAEIDVADVVFPSVTGAGEVLPNRDSQAERMLLDLIGGRGATFWKNRADPDDRVFEVRREGKHAGFIEVTENGEVIWIA